LLNENFNQKPGPKQPIGPRQSGQTVTNPRAQLAIALANASSASSNLSSGPLAQALAARKNKKKKGT